MYQLLKNQRIGFIGAGNMAQAMIKGLIEGGYISAERILVSNRSHGKLNKLKEQYQIQTFDNNESLVENSDIVILAMKPQDLLSAVEPISQSFNDDQIVMSIAAGIKMPVLEKNLPQCRLVRVMPNTPSVIGQGVVGYFINEDNETVEDIVENLFRPLGKVMHVHDEDEFDALMIACSSGTGFVFELMMYWQEWLEEHDFTPEQARMMAVDTFLGASLLAKHHLDLSIEELQSRVTSKKGVTAAGLQSMRELEIERALRISFEKADLRNKEMSKEFK